MLGRNKLAIVAVLFMAVALGAQTGSTGRSQLPTGAATAAGQSATQPRNIAQIAGAAPSFCDSTFVSNALAASGNTVITTATAAQKEYVCGWSVNGASTTANTVKLVTGTGGTCGTGQTDFGQAVTIQAAASQAPIGIVVQVPMNAQMTTGTNVDLCVNLSAAQAVNVIVWYHKGA